MRLNEELEQAVKAYLKKEAAKQKVADLTKKYPGPTSKQVKRKSRIPHHAGEIAVGLTIIGLLLFFMILGAA